jgi:hypothetical protein
MIRAATAIVSYAICSIIGAGLVWRGRFVPSAPLSACTVARRADFRNDMAAIAAPPRLPVA